MIRRLPADLFDLLQGSGLPWRIIVGGRHRKIYLGHRFVGILPLSGIKAPGGSRAHLNTLAQIRRAIKDHREKL